MAKRSKTVLMARFRKPNNAPKSDHVYILDAYTTAHVPVRTRVPAIYYIFGVRTSYARDVAVALSAVSP